MIQRKQTLFLLAVVIIAILMLFIPFMLYTIAGETFSLHLVSAFKSNVITTNIFYPFIINGLVLVLTIIVIFLYKNRVLQYKLSNLVVVFNVFITGLFFLLDYINAAVNSVSFSFGAFLPLISAIFAFLAGHFIKKDEQLVRSTDRIR